MSVLFEYVRMVSYQFDFDDLGGVGVLCVERSWKWVGGGGGVHG